MQSKINKSIRVALSCGALLLAGLFTQSTATAAQRPNIVIVLADDVGYSDFGCYGGEIDTPNIDRLADGGIRFTQFTIENKCNPSRTALMTGQYYLRGYDAGGSITIPEGLKAAGYRSYLSGKWDIVADTQGGPLARGFDDFYGTIMGCGSFFAPLGLQHNGVKAEHEWQENPDFYYTHAITDNAVRAIEATPSEAPLFLYVTYTAAHWPMHALPEDIKKYEGRYAAGWDVLRQKRLDRMRAMGIVPAQTPLPPRQAGDVPWDDAPHKKWEQRRMEVYAAMIDSMDQGIGKIIASLEASGRLDNTLFMVLSDNGPSAEHYAPKKMGRFLNATTRSGDPIRVGNLPSVLPGPEDTWQTYGSNWATLSATPFRRHKGFEHQGGHAVPLVIHWPRLIRKGGQISGAVCNVIDLLPTVLDAAALDYPTEFSGRVIEPADGISLLPLFKGEAWEGHEMLFWGSIHGKAVRKGKWKLVREKKKPWELYDMEADRTELKDLARDKPEMVQALENAWYDWRDTSNLPIRWRQGAVFEPREPLAP